MSFSRFSIKTFISNFIQPIFIFLVFTTITGCNQEKTETNEYEKYSIYILGKDGKEYLIQTNYLNSGELKPEREGIEVDRKLFGREQIVKGGYYYRLNKKLNRFSKYIKTKSDLKEVAALEIKDFSIENFCWLGADTLLLTGLDNKTFTNASYYKISVKDFKILSNGSLPIPLPVNGYKSTSLGITKLIKDKLLIAYTYHKHLGPASYSTSDTIYLASLSSKYMTLSELRKDTRSSYPGGINTIQSYSFDTENGDFYFMSCPGIALGNMVHIPTGIFRIKNGETNLDKDYFFNISNSKINNHAYGIWYLTDNKAIIRSERKDLYKDFSDHAATAHFEFYILDLLQKTVTKLNLPLDKGTRRECVIVEGDTAYIAVNSTAEGNFIWLYDIKTGSLKKGLQLSGDTDYIYRIDKN